MNKRPFLLGLGIGLIIGAALLQLMLVGQQQADNLDHFNQDTDTSGSKLYTQEELDSKLAEAAERIRAEEMQKVQKAKDEEQKAEDAKPEANKDTSVPQPQPKAPSAAEGKAAKDSEPGRTIVRIVPGSDLTETAALLEKHGVIENQKSFISLMRKESNKIRAGYFAFEGDLTLQQVKKVITGQPLPPEEAKRQLKE
ncbi:hypothetical protein K0T92_00765 [Paenibacillus oenotherae]|uniref:YceG-like family protein n=1 Tax=Paenibacillus oenotherae TaxID=1435645 RepID=A0ABS7D034_9BACL|nr:hypothetical protein [Paenibacillus oenotherae]MBW7473269.1 hypothetical protein [Paenibacillus oenotherae]